MFDNKHVAGPGNSVAPSCSILAIFGAKDDSQRESCEGDRTGNIRGMACIQKIQGLSTTFRAHARLTKRSVGGLQTAGGRSGSPLSRTQVLAFCRCLESACLATNIVHTGCPGGKKLFPCKSKNYLHGRFEHNRSPKCNAGVAFPLTIYITRNSPRSELSHNGN
jgi:hypothetical protein